jgi:hypothetical protein
VPTRDEHINRAEENEQMAKAMDLSKGVNVGWAITIIYYSALHYVDAYLEVQSIRPPNHEERDARVNSKLKDIYNEYRYLKHKSREARYSIANYTKENFYSACPKLSKIKTYILGRL